MALRYELLTSKTFIAMKLYITCSMEYRRFRQFGPPPIRSISFCFDLEIIKMLVEKYASLHENLLYTLVSNVNRKIVSTIFHFVTHYSSERWDQNNGNASEVLEINHPAVPSINALQHSIYLRRKLEVYERLPHAGTFMQRGLSLL